MRQFCAVLALFAFVCGAAHAEPRGHRVRLAGLDLSAPADVAVAYDRIKRAVRRACRDEGSYAFPMMRVQRACEAELMINIVARIDAPALTQFAEQQGEPRLVLASR